MAESAFSQLNGMLNPVFSLLLMFNNEKWPGKGPFYYAF